MTARPETGEGFSVLDGVALVSGAAVASVHLRVSIREGLTGPGWFLIWFCFAWIAVTAAGPFVYLVRRYARRLHGYPKVGDMLWGILGAPWLVAAVIRPGPSPEIAPEWVAMSLWSCLGAACLIALATVWRTWVMVPPEQAARLSSAPWTNRVGLILSVAWPIQCGAGMVVMG